MAAICTLLYASGFLHGFLKRSWRSENSSRLNVMAALAEVLGILPRRVLEYVSEAKLVHEVRARGDLVNAIQSKVTPSVAVSCAPFEIRVPAVSGHEIPVRLYNHAPSNDTLIVFLHGGGFFTGSADVYDNVARSLAFARKDAARGAKGCVGITVATVEYRLSPEVTFPEPLHDCVDAFRFLHDALSRTTSVESVSEFVEAPNVFPRVFLVGDSAGGNLAAATANVVSSGLDLHAHYDSSSLSEPRLPRLKRFLGLVLVYPCVLPPHLALSNDEIVPIKHKASLIRNANGVFLTTEAIAFAWSTYLGPDRTSQKALDPNASVYYASKDVLAHVPPTLSVACSNDPLRDEVEAYHKRVSSSRVTDAIVDSFVEFDSMHLAFNSKDTPHHYDIYDAIYEFIVSK